jgi:hydroxyacylglutathione hydrolase
MFSVKTLLNGPVEENCYLLHVQGSPECVVVDPGSSAPQLRKAIDEAGLKPVWILATHAHFDHVGAAFALCEAYQAPFACHAGDQELLEALEDTYVFYGMGTTHKPKISRLLQDGDSVDAGPFQLQVLHSPGHTAGGLCYYHAASGSLFSGDTLFRRSIGRSDFEGGDHATLVQSIRTKLFPLPGETKVYPGHGGTTTLAEEMRENPFVK